MSTPAATVSGIVPGKRALTSSSAGSPVASSLTWTLATVVRPIRPATSRAKRSRRLVVQRAAGHRDPRVDLQPLARDHGGDVPVGAGQHVERVLGAGQVLLHELRAVALERLELGAPLDAAGSRASRCPSAA